MAIPAEVLNADGLRTLHSLRDAGFHLKPEWLHGAQSVPSVGRMVRLPAEGRAYHLALYSDLRESGAGCLPAGISGVDSSTIQGKFVLQIDEIVDVSQAAEQRRGSINNRSCMLAQNTQISDSAVTPLSHRTLKMMLTDGKQTIVGMEKKKLPDLSVLTSAGVKIVVQDFQVRRGIAFLRPENCCVLGGMVADLEKKRLKIIAEEERARSRTQIVQDIQSDNEDRIHDASHTPSQQHSEPVQAATRLRTERERGSGDDVEGTSDGSRRRSDGGEGVGRQGRENDAGRGGTLRLSHSAHVPHAAQAPAPRQSTNHADTRIEGTGGGGRGVGRAPGMAGIMNKSGGQGSGGGSQWQGGNANHMEEDDWDALRAAAEAAEASREDDIEDDPAYQLMLEEEAEEVLRQRKHAPPSHQNPCKPPPVQSPLVPSTGLRSPALPGDAITSLARSPVLSVRDLKTDSSGTSRPSLEATSGTRCVQGTEIAADRVHASEAGARLVACSSTGAERPHDSAWRVSGAQIDGARGVARKVDVALQRSPPGPVKRGRDGHATPAATSPTAHLGGGHAEIGLVGRSRAESEHEDGVGWKTIKNLSCARQKLDGGQVSDGKPASGGGSAGAVRIKGIVTLPLKLNKKDISVKVQLTDGTGMVTAVVRQPILQQLLGVPIPTALPKSDKEQSRSVTCLVAEVLTRTEGIFVLAPTGDDASSPGAADKTSGGRMDSVSPAAAQGRNLWRVIGFEELSKVHARWALEQARRAMNKAGRVESAGGMA